MKNRRKVGSFVLRVTMDTLKGVTAALAGFVGLIVGGLIASWVGLPTPIIPAYMNTTTLMPLIFLTTFPIAIVLGECYRLLPFNYWQRFITLFVNNYLLYSLANMLDAFLYSPMTNLTTNFFSTLFPALLTAGVVALLWRPKAGDSAALNWTELFKKGARLKGFAWRICLSWLCYLPIYYLIGLLVVPFTKSYYEDPSHALGLVLPPLWAIVLMQIPRGMVFLLAVLPLLLNWRGSRAALWLWTGSIIFIQVAGTAIFQAYWLPPSVRIPHALEILTDSFLQAGLYILLMVPIRIATREPAEVGQLQANRL